MAKNDRKFNQLTKGVRLTKSQAQNIRRQINQGVKAPTLTVLGIKVTVDQLRTAQTLVDQSGINRKNKLKNAPKIARLKYNAQGIATTRAGVQITREQAKSIREQARRINAYSLKMQYKATIANVVQQSKLNTDETTFYPTRARRAPLAYQRVDFSQFKTQADLKQYIDYQRILYDPKTRTSARSLYLGDTYKTNWKKALIKQVGYSEASDILKLIDSIGGVEFRSLMDSGELDTVGDVYYGDPTVIKKKLQEYTAILSKAAKQKTGEAEDIGL